MSDKESHRRHERVQLIADYRIRQYLAERLKELRSATTWKQEQLAHEIGRTQAQISRYENGERLIPAEDLARIARLLQVPIQDFYPPDLAGGLTQEEAHLLNALRRQDFPEVLRALAGDMKK